MTKKAERRGRPSNYTLAMAAKICERLAEGRSLRTICKADDIPGMRTIFGWLETHKEFAQQYARAREVQAAAIFEETLEIADDAANDFIETEDGPKLNAEHVQRARLRVDTRKWFLSKLAPKKYGERIQQELSGPDGGPIQTQEVDARAAILGRIAGIRSRLGSAEAPGKPH